MDFYMPLFYMIRSIPFLSIFFLFFTALQIGAREEQIVLPAKLPVCPAVHITDSLVASDGALWVVSEGEGVYRLSPGGNYSGSWEQMNKKNGAPDTDNYYTIVEDRQGRIWIGTDNQGVAVFNGSEWKTYDRENALLGERVFDIAVSPSTGEVAVATSGGLTVYHPDQEGRETWTNATRADGLVSDQIESLSFDGNGGLWVAFACGGVAYHEAGNAYKKWETTQAPWYWDQDSQRIRQPLTARGKGLSSNLCNAVLAGTSGTVYLGTNSGLCWRPASGGWQYLRGADYAAKNKGLWLEKGTRLPTPDPASLQGELLPEDYVTCLAETKDAIWIGFRDKGAVLVDPATMKIREKTDFPAQVQDHWVSSFLCFPDGTVYASMYLGGGLVKLKQGEGRWSAKLALAGSPVQHPALPKVKLIENVLGTLQQMESIPAEKNPVVYWKEDWATQGRWCERYGTHYALLCGSGGLYNEVFETRDSNISVSGRIGGHRLKDEIMVHWIHWPHNPYNPSVLHNPSFCTKVLTGWHDSSKIYPRAFDGPDLWVVIKLPAGIHEVSLYFYNPLFCNIDKTNEKKEFARRDYLVEIRKYFSKYPDSVTLTPSYRMENDKYCRENETSEIIKAPVLARTRIKSCSGSGIYKSFLVNQPGYYFIRIANNYSYSTLLNAILISRLIEEDGTFPVRQDTAHAYAKKPPVPPTIRMEEAQQEDIALDCWKKLVTPMVWSSAWLSKAHETMLDTYKLVSDHGRSPSIVENWRWFIKLWNKGDKKMFEEFMLSSWYNKQETYGDFFKSSLFATASPRTVPFSSRELKIMRYQGIDWKQYLPSYEGIPIPSAEDFHKQASKVTDKDLRRLFEKYVERLQEEEHRYKVEETNKQ